MRASKHIAFRKGLSWNGASYHLVWASGLLMLIGTCVPQADPAGKGDALTLGPAVVVHTATVEPEGGTVVVSESGGPLKGLAIEIPADSYPDSTTWRISYSQILAYELVDGIEPLSPLISLEGPDEYSAELIQVTVPAEVPAGYFAMGFYCEPGSGTLEAIPLAKQTQDSVTLATRHFSNVLVGGIPLTELANLNVTTDFLPGHDDWHFPNWGSFITPLGHCGGMCLTELWYYLEKTRQGKPSLWKRYDNNLGPDRITPDFWLDDDSAIRLVSVANADVKPLVNSEVHEKVLAAGLDGDERNFYAIAYALKTTKEPQLVVVRSKQGGPGHALVCYRIKGRTLYVADPNFPGDQNRTITFGSQWFEPYDSGTRGDENEGFDTVLFYGKTSVVKWSQLAGLWADFESGNIGKDRFPYYDLFVVERDETGQVAREYTLDLLNDNYVNRSPFEVRLGGRADRLIRIYRFENLESYEIGPIELKQGSNLLGFYVAGDLEDWRLMWNGFEWVNVVCGENPPASIVGDLSSLNTCTISILVHGYFRAAPTYEWQGSQEQLYDGDILQRWVARGSFAGLTFSKEWDRPANTIPGEVVDSKGSLTVSLDAAKQRVLSFTANKTETSPAGAEITSVTTASITGRDVLYAHHVQWPQSTSYLEFSLKGSAVCTNVSSFKYRVENSESEWFTVTPWTELRYPTCEDADATPTIVVSFSAE